MISLKIAWFFLGDTIFANYKKNEFEALGNLWKILSLDSLKTIGWGGGGNLQDEVDSASCNNM
jgi:hypothetical protein